MSDQRTRELERAEGLEAEVALLQQRLREGTLTPAQLRLLAYTGHKAARSMTHRKGEICCCGSAEDDYEHGGGGVDSYTHGFVHACAYYAGEDYDEDRDCDCEVTEEARTAHLYRLPSELRLGSWLCGLKLHRHALLVAVVAAGAACVPCSCCGGGHPSCRRDCLGELEALSAINLWLHGDTSGVALIDHPGGNEVGLWFHLRMVAWSLRANNRSSKEFFFEVAACQEAAEIAGEQPVLSAICKALQAWVLGTES